MSEKKLKNFPAAPTNEDYIPYITYIHVGTNEQELQAVKGDKDKAVELAKTLGLEVTSQNLAGVSIKAEPNEIRVNPDEGTIERFDKDGNPVEIARGDKTETVTVVDAATLARMYEAARRQEALMSKSKRGRKPKQDKEQEDR